MSGLGNFGTSPIGYLKIFFRRKELIVIPAFIGLIAGICAGIVMPKQYKASTVILVQEGKTDNPLFNNLAVSTTVQERLVGIRESILGWNSLVEVVKRLNLDRDVKNKEDFEKLILGLKDKIKIQLRGGNILYLTYAGSKPEITQAIVQNITDIFISQNVEAQNRETADAITFIEEQLHVYLGKIKSAEIAKLEEQLKFLLVDSTEKHPLVKELKKQIDAKKEELREQNLEYTESAGISEQNTKPMIDEIRRALDALESKNMNQNIVNQKDNNVTVNVGVDLQKVLARDVGVNEEIYNRLLQRIETAKITQRLQSSKEGTYYKIIDPPRIPLKPFKPNRILIAFVGLFLGLISGVGLVIAFEFLDNSFIDVEEAKEYLGVTLFGAISKINTPETVRKEKEQKRWLYSLTFIMGIIMVILTVTLVDYLKL